MDLARSAKKKKYFYKNISWKRKVQKFVLSLGRNTSRMVSTNKEKAEVLNSFFASYFRGNFSSHSSQAGLEDGV